MAASATPQEASDFASASKATESAAGEAECSGDAVDDASCSATELLDVVCASLGTCVVPPNWERVPVVVRQEGYASSEVDTLLHEYKTLGKRGDCVRMMNTLADVKKLIHCFDIRLAVERFVVEKSAAQAALEGQDVIALMGMTDQGKTTTLLYLAGETLQYNRRNGGLEASVENAITTKFRIGKNATSETEFVQSVEIGVGASTVSLVDTVGWEDSRGAGRTLASWTAAGAALRSCRSVRVAFVIQADFGLRGHTLKTTAKYIASLVSMDCLEDMLRSSTVLLTHCHKKNVPMTSVKENCEAFYETLAEEAASVTADAGRESATDVRLRRVYEFLKQQLQLPCIRCSAGDGERELQEEEVLAGRAVYFLKLNPDTCVFMFATWDGTKREVKRTDDPELQALCNRCFDPSGGKMEPELEPEHAYAVHHEIREIATRSTDPNLQAMVHFLHDVAQKIAPGATTSIAHQRVPDDVLRACLQKPAASPQVFNDMDLPPNADRALVNQVRIEREALERMLSLGEFGRVGKSLALLLTLAAEMLPGNRMIQNEVNDCTACLDTCVRRMTEQRDSAAQAFSICTSVDDQAGSKLVECEEQLRRMQQALPIKVAIDSCALVALFCDAAHEAAAANPTVGREGWKKCLYLATALREEGCVRVLTDSEARARERVNAECEAAQVAVLDNKAAAFVDALRTCRNVGSSFNVAVDEAIALRHALNKHLEETLQLAADLHFVDQGRRNDLKDRVLFVRGLQQADDVLSCKPVEFGTDRLNEAVAAIKQTVDGVFRDALTNLEAKDSFLRVRSQETVAFIRTELSDTLGVPQWHAKYSEKMSSISQRVCDVVSEYLSPETLATSDRALRIVFHELEKAPGDAARAADDAISDHLCFVLTDVPLGNEAELLHPSHMPFVKKLQRLHKLVSGSQLSCATRAVEASYQPYAEAYTAFLKKLTRLLRSPADRLADLQQLRSEILSTDPYLRILCKYASLASLKADRVTAAVVVVVNRLTDEISELVRGEQQLASSKSIIDRLRMHLAESDCQTFGDYRRWLLKRADETSDELNTLEQKVECSRPLMRLRNKRRRQQKELLREHGYDSFYALKTAHESNIKNKDYKEASLRGIRALEEELVKSEDKLLDSCAAFSVTPTSIDDAACTVEDSLCKQRNRLEEVQKQLAVVQKNDPLSQTSETQRILEEREGLSQYDELEQGIAECEAMLKVPNCNSEELEESLAFLEAVKRAGIEFPDADVHLHTLRKHFDDRRSTVASNSAVCVAILEDYLTSDPGTEWDIRGLRQAVHDLEAAFSFFTDAKNRDYATKHSVVTRLVSQLRSVEQRIRESELKDDSYFLRMYSVADQLVGLDRYAEGKLSFKAVVDMHNEKKRELTRCVDVKFSDDGDVDSVLGEARRMATLYAMLGNALACDSLLRRLQVSVKDRLISLAKNLERRTRRDVDDALAQAADFLDLMQRSDLSFLSRHEVEARSEIDKLRGTVQSQVVDRLNREEERGGWMALSKASRELEWCMGILNPTTQEALKANIKRECNEVKASVEELEKSSVVDWGLRHWEIFEKLAHSERHADQKRVRDHVERSLQACVITSTMASSEKLEAVLKRLHEVGEKALAVHFQSEMNKRKNKVQKYAEQGQKRVEKAIADGRLSVIDEMSKAPETKEAANAGMETVLHEVELRQVEPADLRFLMRCVQFGNPDVAQLSKTLMASLAESSLKTARIIRQRTGDKATCCVKHLREFVAPFWDAMAHCDASDKQKVEGFVMNSARVPDVLRRVSGMVLGLKQRLVELVEGDCYSEGSIWGEVEHVENIMVVLQELADTAASMLESDEAPSPRMVGIVKVMRDAVFNVPSRKMQLARKLKDHEAVIKSLAASVTTRTDTVARKEYYQRLTTSIKALDSTSPEAAAAAGLSNPPNTTSLLQHAMASFSEAGMSAVTKQDWSAANNVVNNLASLEECPVSGVVEVTRHTREDVVAALSAHEDKLLVLSTGTEDVARTLIGLQVIGNSVECRNRPVRMKVRDMLKRVAKAVSDKQDRVKLMMDLAACLRRSEGGVGTQIVSEYSEFEAASLEIFNSRISGQTPSQLLAKFQSTNNVKPEVVTALEESVLRITQCFRGLVRDNVTKGVTDLAKKTLTLGRSLQMTPRGWLRQALSGFKLNRSLFHNLEELVAHVCAVWSLVMRDSNSVGGEYCRKPHTVQILAICCGLGWATGRPLEGSLVQVGTGEGKSLILAVLSICYSFAGLQPYIACYSAYLSTRDSASFKALFKILNVRNVFYGTINQCVENVICGDELREKVSQKLDGEPCCEDWRNSGSKRILLIDEVDVFFEESFYGQSYVASLKRPSPGIKCLTDYLWEHRSDKEAIAHQQVVTTEYFKKAALSCKHFEALFSEAVRIMLQDLKDYQGNQWQVNEEKLRDTGAVEVGFVDQDCVDYSKTCDYQNMWAAYERCEVGYPEKWLAQREEHLRAAVYLLFKIGHFSYAHLAKEEFDYVLGASGTLPSEGSSESQILRDFGLTSIVRMPSVYGDCQLKFFPKGGDVVASDNHFTQLMQEVEKRRDGGKRAVLVFFESAAVLNDYMKRAGDTQSFTVTRMVEGFSHAEKARLTLSAATPGTVTFATRTYGRGTDFVVHDSRLLEAGGIHGIQTFMGSASEHIQIKGRQARQGQNGSFSMVLDAERLEALQISAETATTMSKESSLYENLVKKSSEHVGRTLESQGAEMKSLELLHHASMDLRSKLHKLSPAEVTSALLPRNKGPRTGQRSRSLILLDGTGSMGGLIHSAKAVLCETFKRLFATMHDAGVTTEFALQLAIYRNYNHKPFVHSKWSSSAEPLLEFISPVVVEGGYGEEAVELGLQHAANENEADGVSQVILMGDAPANPSDRWPEMTTDYAREADRLAAKSVPVHTFVLADWARTNFEDISKRTGGTSCSLDVNSPGASDIILNHWSTCVLEDIGGSDLVEVYKKKYSYA